MENKTVLCICIMLASVFLGAVSQVLLKKAAEKPHASLLAEYLNPPVIIAYLLFFGCTVLTVFAYRGIPLSLGPVLEATSYIYVTIFGAVIFHEKLTLKKTIALLMITAGVVLTAVS